MAGSNQILKNGQILFHEGERSDGMYLIRKGEIMVFLEKGEVEVKLATLQAGSMLGEMSLFDHKPRSASAKAVKESEITKITIEDFKKIMKQIPKWFVSLMASLSTRLRETNDRLKDIEAKANQNFATLDNTIKVMQIISLFWYKYGVKEGKNWQLEMEPCEDGIAQIMDCTKEEIDSFLHGLEQAKIIIMKKDSYNKLTLSLSNRGILEKFIRFSLDFSKSYPGLRSLPQEAIEILETLRGIAAGSAYENLTVPFTEVIQAGEKMSFNTTKWKDMLPFFKNSKETLTFTKVSGGIGFRIVKKDFPRYLEYHKALKTLSKN